MRAAKSGETAIVKLLLDAGADPKATLANGNNALMFAAGLGWRDGSPAAPSYDQGSPEDAVATIELLLTKGLDINGTNTNGDTPLPPRIGRAAPEIVAPLIRHGPCGRDDKRGSDAAGGCEPSQQGHERYPGDSAGGLKTLIPDPRSLDRP